MRKPYSISGICFMLAGLAMVIAGVLLPLQDTNNLTVINDSIKAEGITVTGTVVSVSKTMKKPISDRDNPDAESRIHEVAKVQYQVKGNKLEVTASRKLGNFPWESGQSVNVIYAESDPKKAFVNDAGVEGVKGHPFLGLLLILSGGGSFLIGLILIFTLQGKRRK